MDEIKSGLHSLRLSGMAQLVANPRRNASYRSIITSGRNGTAFAGGNRQKTGKQV